MSIGPIKYYLMKLLNLNYRNDLLDEINNYLTKSGYNVDFEKIANDQKNNIEPLLYLENKDNLGFACKMKDERDYYNIVESTFVMDENSPLLDYEVSKNTVIDENGFDIIMSIVKDKDNSFEAYLSYSSEYITGYITTSDMKRINLHFMALNNLIKEISDEKLLLTFAMKELDKQIINYIELNKIDNNKEIVRRIK